MSRKTDSPAEATGDPLAPENEQAFSPTLSTTTSNDSIDSEVVPLTKNPTTKASGTPTGANASLRRRSSAAVLPPSFEPGAFSAIKHVPTTPRYKEQSVIAPPVPESLPTTPGYELNGVSYFDMPTRDGLPHQQTVLARGGVDDRLEDVTRGMTIHNPPKSMWRLVATIIFSLSAGLSDGAPGAILPRIETYYGINYTVVSLIWMANALGFIVIAMISHKLQPMLGARRAQALGCIFLLIMYAMVSSASKFPVVVLGFFFGGLGLAIIESFQNVFLSRFDKASTYLGYYHGAYGMGACIGPMLATAMVNSGAKWSEYYYILLGTTTLNFFNLYFSFSGYERDAKAWEHYDPLLEEGVSPGALTDEGLRLVTTESINLDETSSKMLGSPSSKSVLRGARKENSVEPLPLDETTYEAVNLSDSNETSEIHDAVCLPKTWYMALFVLCYQGAEVSLGGWVVTFLEVYRHGSTKTTGYVASGFWGGLTVGRLFLTPNIHRLIGAKRGVSCLVLMAFVCSFFAWLLPVLTAEAVFISIIGLVTGPVYPLMVTVAVKVLPRKIQVIALTIVTAFGSSGGAIFPFLVGLISQTVGTYVVMPIYIGLLTMTLVMWYLLPNPDRSVVRHKWQRLF